MKDKEKQICETVGDVLNKIGYYKKRFKHTEEINALIRLINKLSNENIELKKKLPEDSVVLSREEFEKLTKPRLFISKTHLNNKDLINELNRVGNYGIIGEVSGNVELLPTRAEIEKETAEYFVKEYGYLLSQRAKDEIAKQFGVEIKE